jgi:hypothetical protein
VFDGGGAEVKKLLNRIGGVVAWSIGMSIIVAAMYGAFAPSKADAAESRYILQCERAGGVVVKTSGGTYCMKKELFIEEKELEPR